jgi:phosphoglycolate phosphatase
MKIFLDLDGTILDIKYRYYKIYSDLLLQSGFKCLDIETYWELKRSKTPEEMIAAKTATDKFAEHYAKNRIHLIETVEYLVLDRVFDDVHEILEDWSVKHDLYLVTLRKNRAHLNLQLQLLDLHKYFRAIYNDELGSNRKDKLIKHKVFNSCNCVIIGDTESDIEAGKQLGIKTIALTRGIRKRYLLEDLCPDIIISDLSQALIEED